MMKAFLFPGQGSQRRGMGEQLFSRYPAYTATVNDILGYDITTLCLEDPDRLLNQTAYTQPALYVVNALTYIDRIAHEEKPDFVLGHSLGEYVALFAAGVFSFETGLQLVKKRAEIMAAVKDGGMAALLGLKMPAVEKILQTFNYTDIDIANYNSAEQIVISGLRTDILAAQKNFEASGAKLYYPLNVSGAFHSHYLKDAAENFGEYVKKISFSPPQIPVIANVSARPYTAALIPEGLTRQIASQVKWYESVSYLICQGDITFHEIGPGDVLTKMMGFIQANPLTAAEMNIIPPKPALKVADKVTTGSNGSVYPLWLKNFVPVNENGSPVAALQLQATQLGAESFRQTYGVKYAYAAGAMFHGIASQEQVLRLGQAGILSFLGTEGLTIQKVEEAVQYIKEQAGKEIPYGVNLWSHPERPETEDQLVALFIRHGVKNVEAAAYLGLSKAIVYYRVKGLYKDAGGNIVAGNRIMAKLSRPEIVEIFLEPAPKQIVDRLLEERLITAEQAEWSQRLPMADDICAEADSAGHTDRRMPYALLPVIRRMRDEAGKKFSGKYQIRVGVAGGIGTPESAAASYLLGADFIMTGSVNQCTLEAGTSNSVKDMLVEMNIQDTDYAPAGDLFEMGTKIQVLKKGLFFPARANKLFDLYRRYESLDELPVKDRTQLEERYFKNSLQTVFDTLIQQKDPAEISKALQHPKYKMSLVFKSYFSGSMTAALSGNLEIKEDYQVHCSPALGAFNQWVKGTALHPWRNRHADEIAMLLMLSTAVYLGDFFTSLGSSGIPPSRKTEQVLTGSVI
ncbi:trans-AT polyketide synthase/acyltransferase/oxidoreductase domain-containing protein [Chitinophaga niastensis]|uniref:[acyl-carrier-protein] S-malonyltransferase n=1 Tax=Chitinophaga niastensis TaxID=536980 RepID=A0A2P8HPR2_CHINA|nr:ACP S-malonyltransferase [Chitinophaga niastensis]PSL48192.1 trans-AT polyketide synthase/acyltransferase/oxidoreductase domain-containing protein [Chitinophaga niastensis]